MSVQHQCGACGAISPGGAWPPCRHFRHNRKVDAPQSITKALGPLEAALVKRRVRPPWWPR